MVHHKKVYVDEATNLGKGLFARREIKKSETVFIVKGVLVHDSYDDNYQTIPNAMTIGEGIWLDPFEDNPWRYINHSCKPNCGLRGKVTVVAMRDILAGEHLTIDYAITEDDPNWQMQCDCGSDNCRKIIGGIRSLPKELFRKYEPYIRSF